MNKRGFTLVEIIVVIGLLAIIGLGTTFAIIKTNEKRHQMELEILVANQEKFQNALDVYLSNHKEIEDKVKNDYNGAVISLEVLKNEGLISDNMNIDYKDNYYVLTHALLTDEEPSDATIVANCKHVAITALPSWISKNAKGYEDALVYYCPKEEVDECQECQECSCDNEYSITDPKNACENNKLSDDSLACKVITKAYTTTNNSVCNYNNKFENSCFNTANYTRNDSTALLDNTKFGEYVDSFARLKYGISYSGTPTNEQLEYVRNLLSGSTVVYLESGIGDSGAEVSFGKSQLMNIDFCKSYTFDNKTGYYSLSDCYRYNGKDSVSIVNDKLFNYGYKYYKYNGYLNIVIGKSSDVTTGCVDSGGGAGIRCYFKNTSYTSDRYVERSLRVIDDDYGKSYYFKGEVKDNYVSYNGKKWRIVRILGDGSVKLILNEKLDTSKYTSFSETFYGNSGAGQWGGNEIIYGNIPNGTSSSGVYKAKGYLNYDFGNGCWTGFNVFSVDQSHFIRANTIKDVLNNSISNLVNVDDLKFESTCLDLPIDDYEKLDSITDTNPFNSIFDTSTLKCSKNTTPMANTLPAFISILTLKEAVLSGMHEYDRNNSTVYSYLNALNITGSYYTITPYSQTNTNGNYDSSYGVVINNFGYQKQLFGPACPWNTKAASKPIEYNIVPTIILKSTLKVSKGNGTLNDPYVITGISS